MNAAELLVKETILLELEAANAADCLDRLAEQLKQAGFVTDKRQFLEDVQKREHHASTGIGFGVAIPHGKSAGVAKPGLAFARVCQPLDWNALDGNPVSVILLLAIPQAQAGTDHLRILAAISKALIHEEFRQRLFAAKSQEDIISAFTEAL